MTDRKELESLIARASGLGAFVSVKRDETGYPVSIAVRDLKGFGPYPMAPIYFAERMREALA